MKRIHVKPKPLPRIVRIALCVLAAAVLLFVVYAVSGYPACSPEQALRRAERRALISMRGEVLASKPQMLYNGNATRLLAVEYGDVAAGFYGVSQNGPLRLGWGAGKRQRQFPVPIPQVRRWCDRRCLPRLSTLYGVSGGNAHHRRVRRCSGSRACRTFLHACAQRFARLSGCRARFLCAFGRTGAGRGVPLFACHTGGSRQTVFRELSP